jgi:Dolichyl-phosphate-mannose-protein mannosyltransferase
MTTSQSESRVTRWAIPTALFLGALLLVGITLDDYGVTWDEPPYFHASDLHISWIFDFSKKLARGDVREGFRDENITAAWHWNPYNVPHPPFSRIVSGVAKSVSIDFVDKFSAYRIGPALFFATLVVMIYLWMKELFGRATGVFSAFALILTPNLFGYAHIAVTDLPLATMWLLTAYCFWKGLTNWKWSITVGVVWGLALSTKFPALLIPAPLVVWAHLFHRDKYANNIFSMLFLAPVIMVATQPYLWHQSGMRILEFLYEGISRAYRPETNYTIYFLNQLYFTNQLPWYYPFYMIGITMPEPLVVLAALGVLAIPLLQEGRSTVLLFLANVAFIVIMALMPGAVLHDGVRQLLSSLPFLVALAGVGYYALASWLIKVAQYTKGLDHTKNLKPKVIAALFLLVCFNPALDLYLVHPFQMSYYNRFVGEIQGAYERGLETTYFMEAFTPSFLRALNEKLPKNATINASFANFMFEFYQKEGILRDDIRIVDSQPSDFYLLLNRRSILAPRERRLIGSAARPYISVEVAGVPLVLVFDFRQRS